MSFVLLYPIPKSTPQTLKIREVLQKSDYIGVDFVGVRRHESAKRSEYEYENFGKKQKGQFSHNPILDWNSAEIWMYLYANNLPINEAYKKGNSRAGCLFCPMSTGKSDFFTHQSYSSNIKDYVNVIFELNERDKGNPKMLSSYVTNGGWNSRRNGRDLSINQQRYHEELRDGVITITITNPLSDWKKWINTVDTTSIHFLVNENPTGYSVTVAENQFKQVPSDKKKFKQVFKKAAHCVNCRACESHCSHNCLTFKNGLEIKDCKNCGQCHDIEDGCLVYHSLRTSTTGGGKKMKSIDSFGTHAPKIEWLDDYLKKGEQFWENNTLGPSQVDMFKHFVGVSGLRVSEEVDLFKITTKLGLEHATAWGLILTNLAYNPQIQWYIKNMELDKVYLRDAIKDMLLNSEISKNSANCVANAWKRFCMLPLGVKLNFGNFTIKGRTIATLTRTKCDVTDSRVILYSLYKFAEACEGYYQFSLTRLLNHEIDSSGMSPTLIFGLNQEDMEGFLNGLTVEYPEFINATFTHDLDKISLMEDKTSEDVLKLF